MVEQFSIFFSKRLQMAPLRVLAGFHTETAIGSIMRHLKVLRLSRLIDSICGIATQCFDSSVVIQAPSSTGIV